MKLFLQFKKWGAFIAVMTILFGLAMITYGKMRFAEEKLVPLVASYTKKSRTHHDHQKIFDGQVTDPRAITKKCLECHPKSGDELLHSSHFEWLGDEGPLPGREGVYRIGKRNLLNNFCIGIGGNWEGCSSCHAGYGWRDKNYDFSNKLNVDCLVCHDWSGSYSKVKAGMPREGVDLVAVAKSVGYSRRDNCGTCHFFGGGGMGVKHGDLDVSLLNPSAELDVHMGKLGFQCTDCHTSQNHKIKGKGIVTNADRSSGVHCIDCHKQRPHKDERYNTHTAAIACATCHIPEIARSFPTKMSWDWSKAGDMVRADDVHRYMKNKGEFTYDSYVAPEYFWFNEKAHRYLTGDKIDPKKVVEFNRPEGSITDPSAKISPFKVHNGKQPYDVINLHLLPVTTSGKGGYWHEHNWGEALTLGAEAYGLNFSGKYDFAATRLYWPQSHGVAPKGEALRCADCHGSKGRMDFKALGYDKDPMTVGGRR